MKEMYINHNFGTKKKHLHSKLAQFLYAAQVCILITGLFSFFT